MWVLVKDLPSEIQVITQNLRDTKFYKVYDMRNRYIGSAKKTEIERSFKKEGRIWVRKQKSI